MWFWAFPVFILLAIAMWPDFWHHVVRNQLSVSASLDQTVCAPGSPVSMKIIVENHSWLPLPFIQLDLKLPEGLSFEMSQVNQTMEFVTHLWPNQEVELACKIYGSQRGPFSLRETARVQIHDGFGLRVIPQTPSLDAELCVMPPILHGQQEAVPAFAVDGQREILRWLFPDESRFRDVRPYIPGDPVKSISWKASARTGELWTKQFLSSTEADYTLVINAQMADPYWMGYNSDVFDRLCSVAAGMAYRLQSEGGSLKFATNALLKGSGTRSWYGVQTASSLRVLLARLRPYPVQSFDTLLPMVVNQASAREPIVVIGIFFTKSQRRSMDRLRQSGRPIVLIEVPVSDMIDDLVSPPDERELTSEGLPLDAGASHAMASHAL
jgi:uncharacterized protein (DUF58 family)